MKLTRSAFLCALAAPLVPLSAETRTRPPFRFRSCLIPLRNREILFETDNFKWQHFGKAPRANGQLLVGWPNNVNAATRTGNRVATVYEYTTPASDGHIAALDSLMRTLNGHGFGVDAAQLKHRANGLRNEALLRT